jgi:hypothetical protein
MLQKQRRMFPVGGWGVHMGSSDAVADCSSKYIHGKGVLHMVGHSYVGILVAA